MLQNAALCQDSVLTFIAKPRAAARGNGIFLFQVRASDARAPRNRLKEASQLSLSGMGDVPRSILLRLRPSKTSRPTLSILRILEAILGHYPLKPCSNWVKSTAVQVAGVVLTAFLMSRQLSTALAGDWLVPFCFILIHFVAF